MDVHSGGGGGNAQSQFDALKRQATKLERSLEDKVSRYQQVRACVRAFVSSVKRTEAKPATAVCGSVCLWNGGGSRRRALQFVPEGSSQTR